MKTKIKILLLLIINTFIVTSCTKEDNNNINPPIPNKPVDLRDKIIGTYKCNVDYEYWNGLDSFLSHIYYFDTLEVTKHIDSYCIQIPVTNSYQYNVLIDRDKKGLKYYSIVGGGSKGYVIAEIPKTDSIIIIYDQPGLGPGAYQYNCCKIK